MIDQLYIKNVALIEEVLIEFNKGLNILSGETGAGKSIIIGSVTFVLGARATKDFIKKGCEQSKVEAVFSLTSNEIIESIRNMGIEIEEDNSILISRVFTKFGKNICKINGKPVTITMIKEIAKKIIDIHGQHEHQSLLNNKRHMYILDKFCDESLLETKNILYKEITQYKEILNKINKFSYGKDREDKIDILKYQINEINEADLKINEEENLNKVKNILYSAEKLKVVYEKSLDTLFRAEEEAALDKISVVIKDLQSISEVHFEAETIYKELEEIYIKLEELGINLRKINDEIENNPKELSCIEDRLELIHKLKRKYGNDTSEILNFKKNAIIQLNNLINSEEKLKSLLENKEKIESKIKELCFKLSKIRKNKALDLEQQIKIHLDDLGMKNTEFKIEILPKDTFGKDGFDKIEFLISTNIGEDLKPLSKIASGGEMSRIMLSLKAVLSIADNIDTFIFDEIDSGISGRTAQMVAEKMAKLSKKNQIICITHLPQIAVMADQHFLIEKSSDFNSTNTLIYKLDESKIINEISRMTGGASITEHTIASAKEMLEQAKNIKYLN